MEPSHTQQTHQMSRNNNKFSNDEYDSEYDHQDPDLIEDVVVISDTRSNSINGINGKPNLSGPSSASFIAPENDPANDPKRMIKYQGCWIGAIINFALVIASGYLIFNQFDAAADLGKSDQLVLGSVFKIRYALVFVYFLVSLLHKPYVHEFRNSEAPIIAYSILEVYYNLYNPEEEGRKMWGLLGAVLLPLVCCIRRKKFMNFFNPWNKDKTDIKKMIAAAKRLFTDLGDL